MVTVDGMGLNRWGAKRLRRARNYYKSTFWAPEIDNLVYRLAGKDPVGNIKNLAQ